MPSVTTYGVEVDVDVDIDVDEFLDECSPKEIESIIEILKEDGYLPVEKNTVGEDNLLDIEYKNALNKLYNSRIYLTLEEEAFIKQLANKF